MSCFVLPILKYVRMDGHPWWSGYRLRRRGRTQSHRTKKLKRNGRIFGCITPLSFNVIPLFPDFESWETLSAVTPASTTQNNIGCPDWMLSLIDAIDDHEQI